jgi:hypothetical protein
MRILTIFHKQHAHAVMPHYCFPTGTILVRAGCSELAVNELQIMSREDEISLNTRSLYIVVVASDDDICSVS